jgi:hypothetical protein
MARRGRRASRPGAASTGHRIRRLASRRPGSVRRSDRGSPKAHRSFDPRLVGRLETRAWVTYYRREWWTFLCSAVGLTRHTFALPWPQTLYGAWLVLRANQLWAPFPDNDPEAARRTMERFYRLVKQEYAEPFDSATAARLEVEWWRVHREHQHSGSEDDHDLTAALAALYAYVYSTPETMVRLAAEQRALAMRHSDQWVRDGCHPDSPAIDQIRAALVRSYAALLSAVHQP